MSSSELPESARAIAQIIRARLAKSAEPAPHASELRFAVRRELLGLAAEAALAESERPGLAGGDWTE